MKAYLKYKFDSFLARGGKSIFILIAIGFVALLAAISIWRGAFYLVLPDAASQHGRDFFCNLYITFLQMTDPGNMAQDITSSPWFKFFSVVAGLAGVVIFSTLIAVITTALDTKLGDLKKGHSAVLEEGHTIILGWNSVKVAEIIRELVIAKESERSPCVVILAEESKEWMDDYLNVHLKDRANLRIVTRSGSISSIINLHMIAINKCQSLVVVGNCSADNSPEEKARSDANVVKAIMALNTCKDPDVHLNIVAEVYDRRKRDIILNVSPDEITCVDANEVLAKIMVQSSRSTGLSVVYREILSFDGCEMYFAEAEWNGKLFSDLVYHFADGIPIGVRHADGTLLVHPRRDYRMKDDDEIIIIADDDSTIQLDDSIVATHGEYHLGTGKRQPKVEKELIIGWTPKVPVILREYDDYLIPGSRIDLVIRQEKDKKLIEQALKTIRPDLNNIEVNLMQLDPLSISDMMGLDPYSYDNIIILGTLNEWNDPALTDSETLTILLLLRSCLKDHNPNGGQPKLIAEVLDSDNHDLMSNAGVNDFIISNQFISMLLAQVSEDREIVRVYDDLFQEEGSEIYLKPAGYYFDELPMQVTFADLIFLADQRDEICLGYKVKELEEDQEENFGVRLNPDKNAMITLDRNDCLVVLSEDDN